MEFARRREAGSGSPVGIGDAGEEGPRSDARLVRLTLAGDREAFEEIVRRHYGDLLRSMRRYVGAREDAEDLVQETFLRAYRALDRYDPERRFWTWIWTIAYRLALNHRARKGRTDPRIEDRSDGSGPIGSGWLADHRPVERIEERLTRRAFTEALERLDPEHRAVLLLRVLEERTYEEIAAILELPAGTVMSRLSRARSKLRERMGEPAAQETRHERPM